MPAWTRLPLDYEPWAGGTDVFVKSETTFDASFGKVTAAKDTGRQAFFQEHLRRISWHIGSETVPVFIDFNGDRRRMDKGCIGHAVAAGFLDHPSNGRDGYVTEVTIAKGLK